MLRGWTLGRSVPASNFLEYPPDHVIACHRNDCLKDSLQGLIKQREKSENTRVTVFRLVKPVFKIFFRRNVGSHVQYYI